MAEVEIDAAPLSPLLQNAFRDWTEELSRSGGWVILRGWEGLPVHAGFDLDVLVSGDLLNAAIVAAQSSASRGGLKVYSHKKSARAAKLLWIDLDAAEIERGWLLIDLQTRVAVTAARALGVRDIGVERAALAEVPVPRPEWQKALAAIQALRKRDFHQNAALDLHRDEPAFTIVTELLGEEAASLIVEAAASKDTTAKNEKLSSAGVAAGIAAYTPAPPAQSRGLQDLVKLALRRHRPMLFAFCGPDGVGKSTTIGALQQVLSRFPVATSRFHHLVDTKGVARVAQAASPRPERGVLYRGLRAGWRHLLPSWIKTPIVGVGGEIAYARDLLGLVSRQGSRGRLCIADRYAYDRWVKMNLDDRHFLQKLAARINCRWLPRPRLTVILSDDPQRIHDRKPELSVAQIVRYDRLLRELCAAIDAPVADVPLNGRPPAAIARQLAGAVFDSIGDELIDLVSAWEKTERDFKPA